MAKAFAQWTVLPHGPIEKLSENVWVVQGSLPSIPIKRNMTVVRLGDGRLVVHSAIAVDDATRAALEAWGTPAFLVVPNGFHRLDAPSYKQRYPRLQVLTAAGSRKRVEEVIAVDGTGADFAADAAVRFEPIPGLGDIEEAMIVRSADGVSVVVTDCVFNMDRPRQLVAKLITALLGSAPGPRVTRIIKLVAVKDRTALRGGLERLAELPGLTRLIVNHDKVARGADAAAALRQAATFL